MPDVPRKPDQPTFEQALEEVESIVRRIESGEVGLEDSIAQYERGVALLKRCRGVLEQVEQRVSDLTAQMNKELESPGGSEGASGTGRT
ncbi:MAG: exodeoxyribonuclease VII small subunit [Phycisphaerales bacterium]